MQNIDMRFGCASAALAVVSRCYTYVFIPRRTKDASCFESEISVELKLATVCEVYVACVYSK